jgi:hypothetical protein
MCCVVHFKHFAKRVCTSLDWSAIKLTSSDICEIAAISPTLVAATTTWRARSRRPPARRRLCTQSLASGMRKFSSSRPTPRYPAQPPPPVSVYCLMRSCLTPFYCFANQQKDELLWDPKNAPPKVTMDIRPLDKQDECESRRCVPLPASILTRTRLRRGDALLIQLLYVLLFSCSLSLSL